MKKEYLMKSAVSLVQPGETAAKEFEQLRDRLAEEHNRRMGARPDLERLIGAGNHSMMEDNSRNFCRFMSTLFSAYQPEVFVETVLWVFRAYRAHGFSTAYWPAHLDTFVELVRERLSPQTFDETYPFFNWLITNIPVFVVITDQQMGASELQEPSHE